MSNGNISFGIFLGYLSGVNVNSAFSGWSDSPWWATVLYLAVGVFFYHSAYHYIDQGVAEKIAASRR
jgi:hypothetical protein